MKQTRLYATSVAIRDRAVMMMGPSGSGKSDLALRLIDRGADLISDDYTILAPADGKLLASPPDTIAGKMELRGLGIMPMPHVREVAVSLIVHLGGPVERMPLRETTMVILGIAIPEIALDAYENSAAIKVEMALRCATRPR